VFYFTFRGKKTLESLIPDAPKDGLDLLRKLIHFNPDKRITADDALRHSYVARFHNVSEEIALNYDVVPPLSDDTQLTVDEYRSKLYEVCKNNYINQKGTVMSLNPTQERCTQYNIM
jgi:mitogen-activated protein kinase 15